MELKIKLKKPKVRDREKEMQDKMNWIVKKHRLGELDLSKKSHAIPYKIAVSRGLLK